MIVGFPIWQLRHFTGAESSRALDGEMFVSTLRAILSSAHYSRGPVLHCWTRSISIPVLHFQRDTPVMAVTQPSNTEFPYSLYECTHLHLSRWQSKALRSMLTQSQDPFPSRCRPNVLLPPPCKPSAIQNSLKHRFGPGC